MPTNIWKCVCVYLFIYVCYSIESAKLVKWLPGAAF